MFESNSSIGQDELESAVDALQLMIREGRTIRHWTSGMERLYGWSPKEAVGNDAFDLLKTELPRELAEIEDELAERGEWEGDVLNTRRDGEVIVANSRWAARPEQGARRNIVALDRDVTRERQVGEMNRHLANIVESSDDAIVSKSLGGIVTSWNHAAELIFGYNADEIVGKPIAVLFPPDRLSEEDLIINQIAHGERVDHFETVRRRKDGTLFPVSLTISPIFASDGRIIGASKIVRDISDRRKSEERLQALQAELFHVSRLNTISHMASGLAHELNQPLAAISNYLHGMQRIVGDRVDEPSVVLKRALDQAAEQSTRAAEIVRRLRDFMSGDEPTLRAEAVRPLLEQAAELAMMGWRERGSRVILEIAPDAGEIDVDGIQIQQVLLNLVRNAFEAMEGLAARDVRIVAAPVGPEVLQIDVIDSGPGIPPELTTRLFHPFVTTKAEGMGVGLSISRTIIEAHGGQLWMTPNPGGGTVFSFTLRRSTEAA